MNSRAMSLVELAVAALLMMVVTAGIATFLQRAGTIAAGERGGIELQQNRRGAEREITRSILLAGRGGLPAGSVLPRPAPPETPPYRLPGGLALGVDNNVGADRRILSVGEAPRVAAGSDVLTVRGVFDTLYRLDQDALRRDSPTSVTGRLVVPRRGEQDLADLEELLERNLPLALLIGSAADVDTYGVAELVAADSVVESGQIELAFVFHEAGNPSSQPSRPAKTYGELGPRGSFPLELFRQGAATVGVLRELRYFVRHFAAGELPAGEEPGNRLTRAEVYPGLERAAGDDTLNLAVDISFGIVDLQICLGLDTPNGGSLSLGAGLLETTSGENDDWLWNYPGEDGAAPPFRDLSPWALEEVEISLLASSPWPDRNQLADLVDHIGDRPGSDLNSEAALRHRRSLSVWRVQPRNL